MLHRFILALGFIGLVQPSYATTTNQKPLEQIVESELAKMAVVKAANVAQSKSISNMSFRQIISKKSGITLPQLSNACVAT